MSYKIKTLEKKNPTSINITWEADPADIQLITNYNKGVNFLLGVIDFNSKYAWVILEKIKMRNNHQSVSEKIVVLK